MKSWGLIAVLLRINFCGLFKAKSRLYISIYIYTYYLLKVILFLNEIDCFKYSYLTLIVLLNINHLFKEVPMV